jgi:hypothetical protein
MVREIIVSRFMTNSQSNPTRYIIGFNLKVSENYINYIQKNKRRMIKYGIRTN